MINGLKKAAVAALLVAGLAGCSATNLTAHTVAVDHAELTERVRDDVDISRDRGIRGFRRPKYQHTSIKGDSSKAHLVEGQEHFRNQNFGLAHKSFQKAVQLSSDNASAWLGLAASLDQLGQFKTADRAYEQLTQLKKNNARIYNNMGYSYLLRGDYTKARQYLNRAQEIDPTLEVVQGNLHLLEKTIES